MGDSDSTSHPFTTQPNPRGHGHDNEAGSCPWQINRLVTAGVRTGKLTSNQDCFSTGLKQLLETEKKRWVLNK